MVLEGVDLKKAALSPLDVKKRGLGATDVIYQLLCRIPVIPGGY